MDTCKLLKGSFDLLGYCSTFVWNLSKWYVQAFWDVDLTLLVIGLSRSYLSRLLAEIDESSLPYQFDISIFSKLTNPALIEQIENSGVVLYQRGVNAFVAEP